MTRGHKKCLLSCVIIQTPAALFSLGGWTVAVNYLANIGTYSSEQVVQREIWHTKHPSYMYICIYIWFLFEVRLMYLLLPKEKTNQKRWLTSDSWPPRSGLVLSCLLQLSQKAWPLFSSWFHQRALSHSQNLSRSDTEAAAPLLKSLEGIYWCFLHVGQSHLILGLF